MHEDRGSGTRVGFRKMDVRAVGTMAQRVQDQRGESFPSVSVNKMEENLF